MKILVDDTGYIEQLENGLVVKCLIKVFHNPLQFEKILVEVLTPAQYEKYIANSTNRIFTLSNKKQIVLTEIIKSLKTPI